MEAILETYRAAIPTMNKITGKSFFVNIVKYGLPIVIYERAALLIPQLEWLRIPSSLLFLYLSIHSTIDTTILNLVASKNAIQITNCNCSEKQIIRASLASPFYYTGNLLFIYLLYFVPYIGSIFYWILYPTLYGYSILEAFLSGMCTRHRYKYFQDCFIYCFGMGICIHGLATIICRLIMVENIFFYYSILNILQTQIIMNGRFNPKKIEHLVNPFYLSRAAMSHVITTVSKKVIDKLENQELKVPVILQILNKIKIVLGPEFKTLKSFLNRDICKFLISEHYNKIKQTLNTLIDVSRQTNVIWFVDYFGDIVPDFIISEKTTIVLKILKREGMTDYLIYLRGLFNDIGYESTVTIFDGLEIKEDHFRAMSRSPSLEWEEDQEYIILKYPKNN